ncbi:hypothetical protein FT638_00810 [Bacillus cereus]|nr:hypothetical protein [Bacillus cereus]
MPYLEVLSRYLRAVKLPPQNSAGAKKLGGSRAARKCSIGSTNNQCGMNTPPLIKVSLYMTTIMNVKL